MAGIPINNLSSTIQKWLQAGGDIETLLKEWKSLNLNAIIQKIQIGDNILEADSQHILNLTNYIPKGYEYNSNTLTIAKVISDQIENKGTISSDSLNLKKSLIFNNQNIDLTSLQKLLDTKPWEDVELKILKEDSTLKNIWMQTSENLLAPYGQYNAQLGKDNVTGSMAFNILDLDEINSTFTLDSAGGLEVGDEYSCFIRLNAYDKNDPTKLAHTITRQRMNLGKIKNIDIKEETNEIVVTVDNFPNKSILNINNYNATDGEGNILATYTKDDYAFVGYQEDNDTLDDNGIDYEANTFRIIAKPHLGTRRIGWTAFTEGLLNKALVKCASSRGYGNTSYGSYSDTSGWNNKAGYCATATGKDNESTGETTFTANRGNKAKANNSTAFGGGNIVEAIQGFATGANNHIQSGANNSFISGDSNTMTLTAISSIVSGFKNYIAAQYSFITGEGNGDKKTNKPIVGKRIILTGFQNQIDKSFNTLLAGASNNISHIENSLLTGHAINILSKVDKTLIGGQGHKIEGSTKGAWHSLIVGENHYAKDLQWSAVFGQGNKVYKNNQFVRGRYNQPDQNENYLDIVGNGTSDTKRSNAYTLSKEGVGWFAKGIKIGGANQDEGKDILIDLKVVGDEIDKVYTYGSNMPYICYYIANDYAHSPFEECIILTHEIKTSEDRYDYNQIAISISSGEIKKRSGTSGTKGLGHEDEDWSLVQGGGGSADVDIATPETAGIVKPINNISVNEQGEIDIGYQEWRDDDIDNLSQVIMKKSPLLVSYAILHEYNKAPFYKCSILNVPCNDAVLEEDYETGEIIERNEPAIVQIATDGESIKIRYVKYLSDIQDAEWKGLVTQEDFDNLAQNDWVNGGTLQDSIDEIYQEILGNGYMHYFEECLGGDILVLENGLNARLGNHSNLDTLILQMPEDVDFTSRFTMYNSAFALHCGDTPPTLIYAGTPIRWAGDDVSYDGVFTPQANTIYEVWVTLVDIDKEGNPIISARVGIV